MRGNRRGIESRRHHNQPQVLAPRPLQFKQQSQRQITLQVPLMKLIEHHRRNAAQIAVTRQPPIQHPFGEITKPGFRAGEVFKAHLIANAIAHALAALGGHAPRCQPCRQPSRLEHNHVAVNAIHEVRGHARRLAGTGRGLNYGVPFKRDLGEYVVNR